MVSVWSFAGNKTSVGALVGSFAGDRTFVGASVGSSAHVNDLRVISCTTVGNTISVDVEDRASEYELIESVFAS